MILYQVLVNMMDNFHDKKGAGLVGEFRSIEVDDDAPIDAFDGESEMPGLNWITIEPGEEYLPPGALFKRYIRKRREGEFFALWVWDPILRKVREADYTVTGLDATIRLIREAGLKNTDFVFLGDSAVSNEEKTAWRAFRQGLRDLISATYEEKVQMMKRNPSAFPTPPNAEIAWNNLNGPNPFTQAGIDTTNRYLNIFGDADE